MWWEYILFYVISALVLLIFARVINQFIMKINLSEFLNKHDNLAVSSEIAGLLFGAIYIITTILHGPGADNLLLDFAFVIIYGVITLTITSFLTIFIVNLLFFKEIRSEIIKGNTSAGITLGATYASLSILISGAISEDNASSVIPSIIFYLAGLVVFIVFTYLFRYLTSYDDIKEIKQGNNAAALSYSGLTLAVGMIISNAVSGEFINYEVSFWAFFDSAIIVLLLYPVRQFIIQGLILGCGFKLYGGRLDDEISKDKNLGAGLIEAAIYIATSLFSVKLIEAFLI